MTRTGSSDSLEDFILANRLLGCSDQKVNKRENAIGVKVSICQKEKIFIKLNMYSCFD